MYAGRVTISTVEPLTEEQYNPIRSALFDRRNGSATEAKREIAEALDRAGLVIVKKSTLRRAARALEPLAMLDTSGFKSTDMWSTAGGTLPVRFVARARRVMIDIRKGRV